MVEAILDFVCDMRDHLHGAAAEIPVALLLEHRPVDFSCCHIGIPIKALVDEPLVMAEIQICLRPVVGDEYFAVLDRVHRPGIHIDVWVKLLHCHLVSPGL